MPQTKVTRTVVYRYAELSEDAKQKARDQYTSGEYPYYGWWSYEDAKEIGKILGIEIEDIYFDLYVQGAGACFEGWYSYAKGSLKTIKQHAPDDTGLHEIAQRLQQVQARHGYQLKARVKQQGHYSHSGCTRIEVMKDGDDFFDTDYDTVRGSDHDGAEMVRCLRAFMNWIYQQLNEQHDYLFSTEYVEQALEDAEFTVEGRRVGWAGDGDEYEDVEENVDALEGVEV